MLYDDTIRVESALINYYQLNNLPADGGVTEKWAKYKFGPFFLIAFPNFNLRNEAIRRHDVHHILLNLDTSSLGEGLIAAWELGSGCGKYWISWCMESQALWWGILFAPIKTMQLFVLGRHSRNYFYEPFSIEVLNKTVGKLREEFLPVSQPTLQLIDILLFVFFALCGLILIPGFFIVVFIFSVIGLIF